MSEEIIALKLKELKNTKDLRKKRELATEIALKTSDPILVKEMEGYLRFNRIFRLS